MGELLGQFARFANTAVEAAAVIAVAYGSAEAFSKLLWAAVTPGKSLIGWRKAIWRRFGMWLLLGLEFELAADIIRSVVSPTIQDLIELGAIAVIRTFLNDFLQKDLEGSESGEAERSSKMDGAAAGVER
jgi:uncharacterized membrane protein